MRRLAAAWRRIGGPALLPWLTGFALVLIPAAATGVGTRYLVGAIPPLCLAAAIGVQQIAGVLRGRRARAARRQPAP
jgi:hypothetical protein